MSVKHVKDYFDKICKQRQDLIEELADFEEECRKGLYEPERLDNIKESVRPLMDNYERWSYMMYLLNLPNKKEKQQVYTKQVSKQLKTLKKENSLEATLKENEECIEKLKS